jgi:DnaJ family protein C protein 28
MIEPESSTDWVRIVAERRIAEAIEEGVFDNLPDKGRPLDLDDDPLSPPHQRIVNRILKNARVTPTWISMEQEIELAKQEALLFRDTRMQKTAQVGISTENAVAGRAAFEQLMRRVNDLVLRYNMTTPFVHRSPIPMRIKDGLAGWDEALASALAAREDSEAGDRAY